jgi:type I restriction enzyme R subunit
MPSQTNEQALEVLIEQALTGSSREERQTKVDINERSPIYGPGSGHGYEAGHPHDFDREFAIDREKFWRFLQSTQPAELAKLKDRPHWERLLLERLDRTIKREGILKVLKRGLDIDDAHFTLYYSLPFNDLNPAIAADFERNIFSVTRQVHYSQADPTLSIDMVLFVNGLALATFELKNAWTGQTTYHACRQYERRGVQETLLRFGRCVVHFAVDTDDVFMTTQLAGANTDFLPFNQGWKYGKGNPPNPFGHKTAYLWEEVLTRQSLANIVEHFAILTGKKKDPLAKKRLFFPRYHQLDVVRRLLAHARMHGAGHTYLIQHSAGSGKSHSITWTAYQLIELFAPGADRPLFDSVVVVTDRRNLDKQLRETIDQFSEVKNIIAPAYTSSDLKTHLEGGKRIITTTIQKFPFVVDGIEDLSDKRFAVILDEAHSSQSGTAADKLTRTLSGEDDDEETPEDVQDKILKVMEGRKLGRNASYFAFTATPKPATLEKFGQRNAAGGFDPIHRYSMKQAIEEGFILDVLANYTTYRSYYEIEKSIRDNPLFESIKAQKKLRAYVEGHRETIGVKAEIMVEHFLTQVVAPRKLKGQAKGMVVTRNIITAIRYFQAIRDELKRRNAPFKVMVAFSGKKLVDGVEYTEESLNGFASKDIEDEFDGDDYRLLVVANKFLTGFDQPKLAVMYVDKKLQGLAAVQTLSRLNRSAPHLGKRTEDLFVLDFFNSAADIKEAFAPYYTATTLSQATDVNVLHDLKAALDAVGVYDWPEVVAFNDLYFADVAADQLSPLIDRCAARFIRELELEEDEKADFKIKAKQFVKIYAQVASPSTP